jgi:hypothetical protein
MRSMLCAAPILLASLFGLAACGSNGGGGGGDAGGGGGAGERVRDACVALCEKNASCGLGGDPACASSCDGYLTLSGLTEACADAFEAYQACFGPAACSTEGDGAYSECIPQFEALQGSCASM